VGSYRGENTPPHSKPLEVSEWTQIIASFGHFEGSDVTTKKAEYFLLVNGEEESNELTITNPAISADTLAEFFIGARDLESFKGSIGLIEIFTTGAVVQTSKYHLNISF